MKKMTFLKLVALSGVFNFNIEVSIYLVWLILIVKSPLGDFKLQIVQKHIYVSVG